MSDPLAILIVVRKEKEIQMAVTIKITSSEATSKNLKCELCGKNANKLKVMNSGYLQYTCGTCVR
jgi:hypothetical protein